MVQEQRQPGPEASLPQGKNPLSSPGTQGPERERTRGNLSRRLFSFGYNIPLLVCDVMVPRKLLRRIRLGFCSVYVAQLRPTFSRLSLLPPRSLSFSLSLPALLCDLFLLALAIIIPPSEVARYFLL